MAIKKKIGGGDQTMIGGNLNSDQRYRDARRAFSEKFVNSILKASEELLNDLESLGSDLSNEYVIERSYINNMFRNVSNNASYMSSHEAFTSLLDVCNSLISEDAVRGFDFGKKQNGLKVEFTLNPNGFISNLANAIFSFENYKANLGHLFNNKFESKVANGPTTISGGMPGVAPLSVEGMLKEFKEWCIDNKLDCNISSLLFNSLFEQFLSSSKGSKYVGYVSTNNFDMKQLFDNYTILHTGGKI